ncbi:hypothetical protein VPH35_059939 [Triticum aestivum]
MRAGPTGWRRSNGGVPVPPLPDVVARALYFAAEVELVRASLTNEQLALSQYAADNHAAWAAYFERRQEQRLASTNGAPVVGSTKNSEGRRVWWGFPGRTLEGVLTHLEGGNNPPLAYPPPVAAPAHRRRVGQWMPRRFGSSSSSSSHSSSRSCSHSSGSPALLGVKAEAAAGTPLGRRTRSAGIVINEGGRRASSSAPSRFVKPKTEPGLAPVKTEPGLPAVKTEHGDVELDDEAALKWALKDFLKMERERECAALWRFQQRRRGRDEGGVVVLDDSDDDDAPPPPPVRHGDAGQGTTRDGRVKEEKADDDGGGEDGGDDGDYSARRF